MNTAAEKIAAEYNPKLMFITCGGEGAYMYFNGILFFAPCYESITPVDTTGAGDCFCGAALSKLLDYNLDFSSLFEKECLDILSFANAAANLSTTKLGAVPSMPEKDSIEKMIKISQA